MRKKPNIEVAVGHVSLAEHERQQRIRDEAEEKKIKVVHEAAEQDRRDRQVEGWRLGEATPRERKATQLLRHLFGLARVQISFGDVEADSFMIDGGQALETVREAAMSAVGETLQPIIDAARQELEAARQERGELIRKAYGRRAAP
jgi:hypothetical protein